MTASAITALTSRNRKQTGLTFKESLGVGKTRYIARFPCDSEALVKHVTIYYNMLHKYEHNFGCLLHFVKTERQFSTKIIERDSLELF